MTGLERYAGRTVGVLGMARSGLAAARALAAAGADVLAFDDRPEAVAETPFRAGAASDVPDLALLLPSPGVPLTHPLIAAAKAANVPIRGDVDLFAELLGVARRSSASPAPTASRPRPHWSSICW